MVRHPREGHLDPKVHLEQVRRLLLPPAHRCRGRLEHFLHEQESGLPTLIKAALAHVQFETIHPFLDGNGRLGRLLITLMLTVDGLLQQPLLY